MRKVVIDLGTNTFHMLVADRDAAGRWHTFCRSRVFVKLAEYGLGHILPDAFERGIKAMEGFREQIEALGFPLEEVHAFGTAALRSADNGAVFIEEAFRRTGIRARAISGDEEAQLIYLGVRQAVPWPENDRVLVMDIGGGSVEFILADRSQIHWKRSFNVGVAVLWRGFHRSDPIHSTEIASMEAFLERELQDLWEALRLMPADTLVGAAGAFDTIDLFALDPALKPPLYGYLPVAGFDPLYRLFTESTVAERMQMPRLLPERIDMIVAAVVLVRYVLQRADIRHIYTSVYSMKEGMLHSAGGRVG